MTHHIKTKAHFTVRFLHKLHLVFGVKRAILYCRFNRRIQLQSFQIDALEQYSRKDNIKITGLKDSSEANETENITESVIKLAKKIDVDLKATDISVSHRIQTGNKAKGKEKKPDPIIVKFVRRDSKIEMLKNKKKLKNSDYGEVYISEDLTKLRSRMLYALRHDEDIQTAFSQGGKIFCYQRNTGGRFGREKKFKIESPDDLFQLGWSEEKVKSLGLYMYSE